MGWEIIEYWSVILAIGGAIVWFIRLEAKVLANCKAIQDGEKASERNAAVIESTRKDQSELMQRIARIESKIDLLIEQIKK
jgi:hypothetical protein